MEDEHVLVLGIERLQRRVGADRLMGPDGVPLRSRHRDNPTRRRWDPRLHPCG